MLMHHLYAGVRAHSLYHRDQHYVVQNDEVVIVDEFTGRMMQGRRWSDGLHQAVEAKEGTSIKNESQTLASITFQNYFRLYKKLSGMTGTADTEAFEFSTIYNLETVLIPTHRQMVRKDHNDQVFITAKEKHQAIINDVKERTAKGQPILLGTTSVENSELLSAMLQKEKMPHNVLNAKQHAREAEIVAQAGRPRMVTIATNMAGRGTDIVLGGNPDPEIQAVKDDEALSTAEKERKSRRCARRGRSCTTRWSLRRPAHHRLRAPRVAPHRQPAARAAPGARATREARASSSPSRTRCSRSSPASACSRSCARSRSPRARRSRRAWCRARSRTRSARSRRATSTSASSCSSTTTSPTTSAR
jgi:hypothetical protein